VDLTDASFTAGRAAKVLSARYAATTTTRGYDLRSYDVSADGQRFLMLKELAAGRTSSEAPTITVVVNWVEELKARVGAR
jgi:hypothetical protein